MNTFPKLSNTFDRRSQFWSQKPLLPQKQQPLQQLQQQSLAKSFSSVSTRPLKQASDRLAESCRGKIDMGSKDDSDLTDLNWLSSLTPQGLTTTGAPLDDLDNVGAEEMLESSMNSNSSTTEHSDASQTASQSTEANSSHNMSHLGQRYHRFLEERRRTEGENRRITQGNQVLLNQSSMMYDSNPQPQYTKPPLSFGALICLAIESSERRRLPVRDIYLWIEGHFPYYKNAPGMSWKNSVRHNLSLSKAFVKIPRDMPGCSKSSDNQCSCQSKTPTSKPDSPGTSICSCGKNDDEGGKGCLWGINDEYRNSLISSFRRSGLSYPLVLPMGGMVPIDGRAPVERSLPEYYSQAALQQQQQPMPLGASVTAVSSQGPLPNFHPGTTPEQFAMEQALVQSFAASRFGDDNSSTFMRNLKFFNQAIKRTRSWMFKEQVEEEEEEDDVQSTVPLESHGMTPEQITELNRLSRRARRRKTRIFRHMTPAPSFEHDYCKNELSQDDLYESETDDEAIAAGCTSSRTSADEAPHPPSPRRPRLSLGTGSSPTRRRHERLMRKLAPHVGHRQALWGHGYRRNAYPGHGRIPTNQINGNRLHHQSSRGSAASILMGGSSIVATAAATAANLLTRRRRPGRPPKVRTAVSGEVSGSGRKRSAPSGGSGPSSRKRLALARLRKEEEEEEVYSDDDADTEPMIDDEDEAEMRDSVDNCDMERSTSLPIEEDDHKAAQLLLGLRRPQQVITDRNNGDFQENGLHAPMTEVEIEATPGSDDDMTFGDGGRANMSPENVPPPTASPNTPKRRGRRPRKDVDASKSEQLRKEKMPKVAKSAPLTPTKAAQEFSEGAALNQRPKRQAAVNAPAVWKK